MDSPTNAASGPSYFRLDLRAVVGAMLLVLLLTSPARAQPTARFSIGEHGVEVRCVGSDRSVIVSVTWTSTDEPNVNSYRVHANRVNEPVENRWVNRYPVVAKGEPATYTILDSAALPGEVYRYRLYGFEESGRLTLATSVTLDESVQPSCIYVPMTPAHLLDES